MRFATLVMAVLLGILSIGAHIPNSTGYDTLSVQVIYAIPSDREAKPEYREAITLAVTDVLEWYVNRLDITAIELVGDLPQMCSMERPTSYFNGEDWDKKVRSTVSQDCGRVSLYDRSVFVIFADVPPVCKRHNGSALGNRGGVATMNAMHIKGLLEPQQPCSRRERTPSGYLGTLAHEMGHALGLRHPDCEIDDWTCHRKDIMWETRHFPDAYIHDTDVPKLHSVLQREPYFGPD